MSKAAATRLHLLRQAFTLIYRKGYQATSIDEIIASTELTKGAFFYHFKNKDEMGLAMIREVMYPGMQAAMIQPLTVNTNALQGISDLMHYLLLSDPMFDVRYGCPAVNLIDEMAPLNPEFKAALQELMQEWQQAMSNSLRKGIERKQLNSSISPQGVAAFIVAGYSGVRNMGKLGGIAVYREHLATLQAYLDSLKLNAS